jgi:tetratricopeptide (TPR) repeat protein
MNKRLVNRTIMRLRRKTPSASEALTEAQRLLAEGTFEERALFTKDVVARFPRDPDLRYHYALTLTKSEPERARAELLHATELDDTDDPVRLVRAADLLLDLDDRDSARTLAERAAGKETNLPTTNLLRRVRGVIAVHDRDYALAERELRAAHESDPTDEFAAKDLGWALVRMGRFDDALEVVDRTLATPAGAAAHNERSRQLLIHFRERAEKARPSGGSPRAGNGGDDGRSG